MRFRTPVWPFACAAIALGIFLGMRAAVHRGAFLENRAPGAEPVAPVAREAGYEAPVGAVVRMTPQGYLPASVTIRRDESVRFENAGSGDQWPVAEDGVFDARGVVASSTSWTTPALGHGIHAYRDAVYPQVTGTVTVE